MQYLSDEDRELIGIGFYLVLVELQDVKDELRQTRRQLRSIQQTEETEIMDLARLQASVAAQTDVIASAETLLTSLAQAIRDSAGDPAALAALADTVDANSSGLAASVVENTPAASTTPDGGGTATP